MPYGRAVDVARGGTAFGRAQAIGFPARVHPGVALGVTVARGSGIACGVGVGVGVATPS